MMKHIFLSLLLMVVAGATFAQQPAKGQDTTPAWFNGSAPLYPLGGDLYLTLPAPCFLSGDFSLVMAQTAKPPTQHVYRCADNTTELVTITSHSTETFTLEITGFVIKKLGVNPQTGDPRWKPTQTGPVKIQVMFFRESKGRILIAYPQCAEGKFTVQNKNEVLFKKKADGTIHCTWWMLDRVVKEDAFKLNM